MTSISDHLLASRRRIVVVAVVALLGVVGAAAATGVLGAPSVAGVDNRFAGVNETTTTIQSTVRVTNPNPVGINLGGVAVDYAVEMNGVPMAEGTERGVSVGTGETDVTFETRMRNERIPAWWVSHVRGGEHTKLAVDTTVRSDTLGRSFEAPTITREIDTDLISQFNSTETREVNAGQPFVSDPVAYVNESRARWGNVTDERTPIRIAFEVYNPKSYPLAVSELGYTVTMNNVTMGNGTTDREYVIPAKSSRTVETTVYLENERLDEWWVTHLRRDQVTDLRIDFRARIDAGSAGTVRVPLDPLTYTRTIETDIFGTKSDAASPGTATTATATPATTDGDSESTAAADGESTATATEAESTTATDAGSTATATDGASTATPADPESTTSEATRTPTTTDDGGLIG